MARNFRDKTVVVTGASLGVGAAAAREFAKTGANLVLVARGLQGLEKIAQELSAQPEVMISALDVTDYVACQRMLDSAHDRFGRIDVLVNNAGYHKRGPIESLDPEEIPRMVEVNLSAPLFLARLILPYLERAGGGAIVNVASLAGMAPVPGAATYSATKFGLRAFSFALAEELADKNITVSLVSPGPIDTGFIMDNIDEVTDITFSQPMSTAQQVGAAIVAAAANESTEIAMPRSSGILATIAYLSPSLARRLRPKLQAKGARIKAQYRSRNRG
jgi:short-subunit dehydrogenase